MEKTFEQMQALERSLAYEYACSVIDGLKIKAEPPAGQTGEWIDITQADEDSMPGDQEIVDEAASYLEWRGLLERDPANPNVVSIRDESEALDAPEVPR